MPQADSRSPGSIVAPPVVPVIAAGRLWMTWALARSSLAGAGTAGTLVAASVGVARDEETFATEAEAEAVAVIASARATVDTSVVALLGFVLLSVRSIRMAASTPPG